MYLCGCLDGCVGLTVGAEVGVGVLRSSGAHLQWLMSLARCQRSTRSLLEAATRPVAWDARTAFIICCRLAVHALNRDRIAFLGDILESGRTNVLVSNRGVACASG